MNLTELSCSDKVKVSRVVINRKRLFNVIFGETVQPDLALRGQPLNKDKLTTGLKSDQELHQLIEDEYTKSDVESYKGNAFTNLKKVGFLMRLYLHQSIGKKTLSHLRTCVLATIYVIL